VLSDVMMPTMDGYQLLSAIRSDISINHIPVLLLSAKADSRSRIKGLDLLADDYLCKPFEASLLKSRVHGLLGIRDALNKHLIKQLSAQAHAVTLDAQIEQNKDYTFTERLKTILRENYQNELFSVEEFASAMCLSPRALQLKMKALFDITPSDYIRNTRLEYAAKLLTDSDLTIGLVADNTGFSSQSYFARCFKAKYTVTPKQYRETQTCKSN
jgi:AraC-like DNA-binding protein